MFAIILLNLYNMHPTLRNTLAVIGGIIIGGFINGQIINLSGMIVAPPEGVDVNDIESIKANIHLYRPIHFLMPFLAHALGTLAGAFFVAKLAVSQHLSLALLVGAIFSTGGILMIAMVGGPTWFKILDIGVAYMPMGWLGYKLASPKVITL